MNGKERFNSIEVPKEIEIVSKKAIQKATLYKKTSTVAKYASIIVAACIALIFIVNTPKVTNALTNIPLLGTVVKILQFGEGGKATDGVGVESQSINKTYKLYFNQDGHSISDVPAYTINHKDAPNRLIFTINGVRDFDYEKIEKDLSALPLVHDVYRNIILDDSSIRFVIELKYGVKYLVTEYKDPGYLELKFSSNEENIKKPSEVYYIRSTSMDQGESLAILEEIYNNEGVTFVKTNSKKYAAVIGGFDTKDKAEKKLNEIKKREGYNGELYIDSWMSNERPN